MAFTHISELIDRNMNVLTCQTCVFRGDDFEEEVDVITCRISCDVRKVIGYSSGDNVNWLNACEMHLVGYGYSQTYS